MEVRNASLTTDLGDLDGSKEEEEEEALVVFEAASGFPLGGRSFVRGRAGSGG